MEGSDLAELYYQGLSNKVNILIFFFISFLCTLYSLKNIYIYISNLWSSCFQEEHQIVASEWMEGV